MLTNVRVDSLPSALQSLKDFLSILIFYLSNVDEKCFEYIDLKNSVNGTSIFHHKIIPCVIIKNILF